MSQYQPNAAPGRSFISKINSKFSNLSISNTFTEKDGSTPEDTIIHNAFVRFFSENNERYPEWLGVKSTQNDARSGQREYQHQSLSNAASRYQPVRASYNSSHLAQLQSSFSPTHSRHSLTGSGEEKSQVRRSNTRLQEMYNRTRQQSAPGGGYSLAQPLASSRTNSTSSRLRDRLMNASPSQTSSYGSPLSRGTR